MSTLIRSQIHHCLLVFAVGASIFLGSVVTVHAASDYALTKHIWKLKYRVSDAQLAEQAPYAGWLGQDADGDGQKNGEEIGAGTDPFSPGSAVKITGITATGSDVSLTFSTENGKKYVAQGTADLAVAFSDVAPAVEWTGTGVPKTLTFPKGSNKFFRIRVEDIDTDSDQVGDWAEKAVTLNHLASETVPGTNDRDYVQGQVYTDINAQTPRPNLVTIKAAEPFASEDGPQAGKLTIERTMNLFPNTVAYSVGGTAVAGVDYGSGDLPGSAALPARGAMSMDVFVNPTPPSGNPPPPKGSRSVTATLNAPGLTGQLFNLGSPSTATVIINPVTAPSGTGLLARYYDTANPTYAHAVNFGQNGNFAYTRQGASPYTNSSIVIPFTYNGTPALQVGHEIKITFTSGDLNSATYNNLNYVVKAVNPGANFTVGISGAGLPGSYNGTCSFSIQSFPHPAVITRVDPTVNFDWGYGTPNDVTVVNASGATTNPVDNYSTVWEGYLHPGTAGNYQFQLDADDKARVLLDTDADGPGGLVEILEHGWDGATTPETIGTFKQSAVIPLVVPADATKRYKIRVEHVETTGDARCRLQWRAGAAGYANIPQGNVFSHTLAVSSYTVASGVATVNTAAVHGLTGTGVPVTLHFSSGGLFTPPANFSGDYLADVVDADTITVNIPGAPNTSGAGFLVSAASLTTGWLGRVYPSTDTSFTAPAGRVGIDSAGATTANNGIWGSGTPDPTLIAKDTFSIRWTGQVQPQFSEDYTFVVHADDGCKMWINGQVQEFKTGVSTSLGGSTYTYNDTTGDLVVTYTNFGVTPNSFAVGETVRFDPTSGNLNHAPATSATYNYDNGTGLAVIDYSSLTNVTPGSYVVGDIVEVDPTTGNVNLGQISYVITAATASTFTVNFGAGTFTSGAGNVIVSDFRNAVITSATANTFTVNIGSGRYAAGSTGNINLEVINKPLKDWASMGNERYFRIPMIGGVRYDIQLEMYENTGYSRAILYWFSPSQPKQVIPTERLYPSNGVLAPAAHITPTDATALVGGAFSHPIAGSNGSSVTLSGNPAWLSYAGGMLSGTPPPGSGGDYQIIITITNAAGTSTSVLNLHVEDTGGTIVREYWNGVYANLAAIPVGTAAAGTEDLTTSLAKVNAVQGDFGARIRGYITAPATGNYYFWIASGSASELWISNDDEPINAFKRAWVNTGNAMPETWGGESNQKSAWLALEQGKKYYVEILYKASAGDDNVAVGWLKPGQGGTAPSEVVPGYALSTYTPPPPGSTPGTLYVASMLAQPGAVPEAGQTHLNGVGTATLRLSEDESVAYIKFSYSGLTNNNTLTDWHVHNDAYLNFQSNIMYDPEELPPDSGPQPDGSHKWTIPPMVGQLTKAQAVELIKQGKSYINLHTALNAAGEIRGNFTLAEGSRTFTPPPAPPSWADDSNTDLGAARFLTQASFGPSVADIVALKAIVPAGGKSRYEMWIDNQFALSTSLNSYQLDEVLRTEQASVQGAQFEEFLTFNAWWRNAITGQDQLRQRVAYALSQIHVVSAQGPLDNRAEALSYFYDTLVDNAFGNFRTILEDTTLTPTMGRYLDMLRNDKPDLAVGRIPNENYAREIKQLFSIGLFRMWPDGTLMLTSNDDPIDTYKQREIVGFAHVFTGWDYGYDGAPRQSFGPTANWTRPMRDVPARHFTGPKRVLNNEVLPGLSTAGNQPLDPYAGHTVTVFNDADYQNLPVQELDAAHDQLFNHPNVGPFICRQLIQRMVTSHPSRGYLYRVVEKFNDNGSGVRGDMKAVIKAILLDYEARSASETSKPAYGKQREPVLRVAATARAFRSNSFDATYSQAGSRTITVNTNPPGTPHKLQSGNSVFLDFTSGSPAPWIGSYGVSVVDADTFTVTAQGWSPAVNYNIPANSTTCTVTFGSHWLAAGNQIYADFLTGTNMPTDGIYTVSDPDPGSATNGTAEDFPSVYAGNTFNITVVANASARSGTLVFPRFTPGSYTVSASGLASPNDRRITMDTNFNHELVAGDQVSLNFYNAANLANLPADYVATVEAAPDVNTWTFLASSTNFPAIHSYDAVYQFPLKSLPQTRNGNVSSRPSTFDMRNTDADIDQTPLNSPTVFNFFLPDYKFPGILASQGITTPEFQETAETSVIRQANFLYNSIYFPTNNTSLASFKTGSNALVMDLSAWIGNATNGGLGAGENITRPWTNDVNLDELIDKLSLLLAGNQLSAAQKAVIRDHVLTLTRGRMMNNPSNNSPTSTYTQINTPLPHNLANGTQVTITGVSGGTFTGNINGTHTISNVAANSFRVPIPYLNSTGINVTNARISTSIAYDNVGTPPDADKRDRLNAVIQLILTSPDFTIQR